jgi:hypothetical protein
LSERERLPTSTLVFILLPQGYKPQNGHFCLEAEEGEPTQQVWFREVRLWEEAPQPWWEEMPGIMSLFPLCDHRMESTSAIRYAANAIFDNESDSSKRADLLTILGVFGKLKNRALDVVNIIGREHMRESPLYQEIMLEGEQAEARRSVLQVLEDRFGSKAAMEFKETVNQIDDLEELREILHLATKCGRITQFRRTVAAKMNGK